MEKIEFFDNDGKLKTLKQLRAEHPNISQTTMWRLRKEAPKPMTLGEIRASAKPANDEMIVIISDLHGRHMDKKLRAALGVFLRDHAVDHLILNGDIMDGEAISRHVGKRQMQLDDEIELVSQILADLVEDTRHVNSQARVTWIDGNHEERFYAYLAKNAYQVASLKHAPTLEGLLDMEDLGVEYLDSRSYVELQDGTHVQHRYLLRADGPMSAVASSKAIGCGLVIGDTHRLGVGFISDRKGTRIAVESGCLCTLDPSYMYRKTANWQNGFVVIRFRNGVREVIPVFADKGCFMFDGVVY